MFILRSSLPLCLSCDNVVLVLCVEMTQSPCIAYCRKNVLLCVSCAWNAGLDGIALHWLLSFLAVSLWNTYLACVFTNLSFFCAGPSSNINNSSSKTVKADGNSFMPLTKPIGICSDSALDNKSNLESTRLLLEVEEESMDAALDILPFLKEDVV